jgi:hypothetical protein
MLYVVATSTAILWFLLAAATRGKVTYASGEMSRAHAAFANECYKCHTDAFRRVLHPFDESRKQLDMNDDCLSCHGPTIGHDPNTNSAWHQYRRDEHAGKIESKLACSSCHAEHSGQMMLAVVADSHCTDCHSDLTKLTDKPTGQRDPHITDFHNRKANDSLSGHPPFQSLPLVDPGHLKFTHADHMGKHKGSANESMACSDCHRAGASGMPWRFGKAGLHEVSRVTPARFDSEPSLQDDFMGEVRYSLHCQNCHGLVAGTRANLIDGDGDLAPGRIPHAQPDAIHAYLRREITEYLQNPNRPPPTPALGTPRETALDRPSDRRVASPPAPTDEQSLKEHLVEVDRIVRLIEDELYGEAPEPTPAGPMQYLTARCLKCHEINRTPAGQSGSPFKVTPPNVPSRWLQFARFSHAKHKVGMPKQHEAQDACISCHAASTTSNDPRAVMIPDIDTCVKCHGAQHELDEGRSESVANNCTTCHSFHVPPNGKVLAQR